MRLALHRSGSPHSMRPRPNSDADETKAKRRPDRAEDPWSENLASLARQRRHHRGLHDGRGHHVMCNTIQCKNETVTVLTVGMDSIAVPQLELQSMLTLGGRLTPPTVQRSTMSRCHSCTVTLSRGGVAQHVELAVFGMERRGKMLLSRLCARKVRPTNKPTWAPLTGLPR